MQWRVFLLGILWYLEVAFWVLVVIMIGEGSGNPLQYSCLETPMDRGAWWATVHGVMKSQIRLSDFTFTFHFHALEKEMAPHSSVLAWRIPRTEEPGRLPSTGLHRVRHDWSDLAAASYEDVLYMKQSMGWLEFAFKFYVFQKLTMTICHYDIRDSETINCVL